MGRQLQLVVARMTGRKTVPNVLINRHSIGGGDDLQALDDAGTLVSTITRMGGERIVEARLTGGQLRRRMR